MIADPQGFGTGIRARHRRNDVAVVNLEENLSPSQNDLREDMRSDQLIGRRYRFRNGGLSHRFSGITDDVVVGTGSLVKENCSGPVAENQCSEKLSEDTSGSNSVGVSKKGSWFLEWYKTDTWSESDSDEKHPTPRRESEEKEDDPLVTGRGGKCYRSGLIG